MTNTSIGHAINLTVLAGRALEKGGERLRVFDGGSFSAEILTGDDFLDDQFVENADATLYVIVTGDGLIEEAEGTTVVATAGDVIFVPANLQHRFRQLSRQFKTWRTSFSHDL